ncbi:MAG TPA: GTPase HflX [Terriglobales bacterium]
MERAVLVGVEFTEGRGGGGRTPAGSARAAAPPHTSLAESLAELEELTRSAGGEVAEVMPQRRPRPDPATCIGAGKVAELRRAAAAADASVVIFDGELSPTQQRNLERELGTRVIARTQLILDIFAGHARSREGQLQVELAQLDYLLPRLTGRGLALSRLGGGIGTRGPGETQLETDRRRIHGRIRTLQQALERVRAQRGQQRRQREAVPLVTVALVGYTNAGKSTLFNRLTGAEVLTSSRMFATLDPTLRALRLPSRRGSAETPRPRAARRLLLSDTVGFVRDLPPALVNAFRATLEEVTRARLLLLVTDVTSPRRAEQQAQVERVLQDLGVGATPRLQVWNKADLLASPITVPCGEAAPLLVSARTGAGLEALLERLDQELERALPGEAMTEVRLRLPLTAGKILHLLHERGRILAEHHAGRRIELVARVPSALLPQLEAFRQR